jgi:regulation of enolase protein 1 (concanavalin A-like superfamily)
MDSLAEPSEGLSFTPRRERAWVFVCPEVVMLRGFAVASFAAFVLAVVPAFAEEAAWETVTSKEGQFTVQMPGKPTINKTKTRKGTGGDVKTVMVGYGGDAGVYLAYKVKLPTAVVKGAENDELDAERDALVKEWNGKVIAEKRIRAGDKIGRDFTVRGKPSKGSGTLTLRVRQYLDGDSIYMVAVISLPNRELPEDSGRFLGSLEIGEKRVRAQGTPTVEPKGVDLPGWGTAFDPKKDCKFLDEKKRLTIKVTGSGHMAQVAQPMLNAPRVMREVEGDFVVTVKVVGDFKPGGKSTNPKTVPFNGAGILVWSDADNYIRLERAAVARGNRINTYVNFEEFEGNTRGASHNEVMKGGDCWVRMERKGSRIHGAISFDGTTWKQLRPIQTVWPEKLKVGLVAISSSGLPFTVSFEEYELKGKTK